MNVSKLTKLMDSKKISKAYVLKKTGLTRPTLDGILEGRDFKVSNLEKLAAALNVNVGYFFDEEVVQIREAGRDFVERGKIEHTGTEYNGPAASSDSLIMEVESLKSQLADKDLIIKLLRDKYEPQK